MRSPHAFLSEIAGNPQGEGARLFLMSSYLLLIITCYTTTKAARDSLFVISVGPSQLPILYMLTAACMAVISVIYPRALRKIGLYSLVRLTSLISVGSLLIFWQVLGDGGKLSLYVLYVWVSLFGAITASQAWSVASHVFDAREARRSFAWIGMGGVVGGILGGSLARIVAIWQGTEVLLPICAGLMGLTILILQPLANRERSKPLEASDPETVSNSSGFGVFGRIRESRYLSMMVLLLLAGVLVEAFVDYEFKVIARQSFDSKDHLTSFFGTIASYGGMLALVVQLLITGPLLKRFGVGAAILLLPAALLGAFLLVAARPTLWFASVLKLVDGCLSYSVHRSGMELLYVPIPAKLRASVKALIDLLVDRVGRAGGGLLLLVLTATLSLSVPALSLVAATALIGWLAIAVWIRREYVQAFRVALEKKVIEPENLQVNTWDSTIARALMQALSSEDDRQVLYALNMLGGTDPSRWTSRLPDLLDHRSPAVRSRTIALLTEWGVSMPSVVEKRLVDPDLDVRVEAVRHLSARPHGQVDTRLKAFLAHSDYRVVLAAIHCIARYRLGNGNLIDEPLIERTLSTTGEDGVWARTAAARALAIVSLPRTSWFLDKLLRDSSIDVIREAIRTAGEIRHKDAVLSLISMLARAPLRRDARGALLKMGDPALRELEAQFQDVHVPIAVRARIPKVLSFFGQQEVADFLMGSLHRSGRALDMPILKAVNRMRARSEQISFDADHVSSLIRVECEGYGTLNEILEAIASGHPEKSGNASEEILELLQRAIRERQEETVEKVFRLLHLIYSPGDIHSAYFSFNTRPSLRASAVEFLDNLIDPPLRAVVLPLVEQQDLEQQKVEQQEPQAVKEGSSKVGMSAEEALRVLVRGDNDWLREIAGALASKWGLEDILVSRSA